MGRYERIKENLEWVIDASDEYGIDYNMFYSLLNCECGFQKDNSECIGDSGRAFGRAQFWIDTFTSNCEGEYTSEKDQIYCAARMISQGEEHNWTCYRKVTILADRI